jgi:hypothetical protein
MKTAVKPAPTMPVKRLKQEHVDHALGQLGLEGLRPSKEAILDMQDVVAGKISGDKYTARVLKRHGISR